MSTESFVCKDCDVEKPASEYHVNRSTGTRDKKCKRCRSAFNNNGRSKQFLNLITKAEKLSQIWLQKPITVSIEC